ALEAAPWVLFDGDLSPTYGFTGVQFPNTGSAMSYIVFNPTMTTPVLDGPEYVAVTGTKFMACFAATTAPNNDWMMTQEFTLGNSGTFNFWGKSITAQYGMERFNVLVSTGSTNPSDFTSISGPTYVEAPDTWTQYSYPLNAYANQRIRVAIQCVSNDAFIFLVDDVEIDAPGGTDNDNNEVVVVNTALKGNYPNPFNPETTIAFSTKENGPVSLDIYNIRGQKVRSLVNENRESGDHSVVWNGKDDNGKSVASGVFFYRMKSGKFSSTKKMILMK
ncbi:MAG: choice-of-anchor J domain-containing protein, partial [Candidatus Cloacimonadales bacterium]